MSRKVVRVTADFFVLLDRQLPQDRGPAGEPTVAEFVAGDLVEIIEAFATGWDELGMPIRGRTDYRVLITTGHLVPYVSVYGQLSPVDGGIELVDIDIDLGGPWSQDD